MALQTLSEETGNADALDEAIEIFQQAVDHTSPEHANWFRYQHDLTSALMRLAQRNGDLSAVDEAIQTWQEVVGGTLDGHPSKPGRLSALATTQFMPKIRKRVVEPLPTRAIVALLSSITPRYRVTVVLGAGLGLREGEAFGLLDTKVERDRKRVGVVSQAQRGELDADLKTEAPNRTVPPTNGFSGRSIPTSPSTASDPAATS